MGRAGSDIDSLLEAAGPDGRRYRRGRRRLARAEEVVLQAPVTAVKDGGEADQISKALRGLPPNRVDIRQLIGKGGIADGLDRWRGVHNLSGDYRTYDGKNACVEASSEWMRATLLGGRILVHAGGAVETFELPGRVSLEQLRVSFSPATELEGVDVFADFDGVNGRFLLGSADGDVAARILEAQRRNQIASVSLDGLSLVVRLATPGR